LEETSNDSIIESIQQSVEVSQNISAFFRFP
jgi:hypothetical protein